MAHHKKTTPQKVLPQNGELPILSAWICPEKNMINSCGFPIAPKNPFGHWDFGKVFDCVICSYHMSWSRLTCSIPLCGGVFYHCSFLPLRICKPVGKGHGLSALKMLGSKICLYNLLTKSTNFWTCSILVSETLRYAGQLDPALHQKVIPDPGAGMKEFNWAYAALRLKMQDRWPDGLFLLEFSQSRLCTNHARLISRDISYVVTSNIPSWERSHIPYQPALFRGWFYFSRWVGPIWSFPGEYIYV